MSSGWRRQAFIAGAGILLSSYDMGVMAMALVSVRHLWHLSGADVSLLASVTSLGMIVGSLAGGVLADRYGRRAILAWDYLSFLVAAAISALSPNLWWLVVARLVVGVGVGADFAIGFAFLAEVCPVATRGRTMAWVMWLANFGTVIAYAVGSLFLTLGGPNGWRWTLATGVALAVPLVLWRTRIMESPPWQREHRRWSVRELIAYFRRPKSLRSLGVAQGSYFLYQITDQGLGMFLPLILVSLLGTSVGSAAWSSVVVKAVTIPAALLAVWLIDAWGRRPLQIFGFAGRAVALLLLGAMLLIERTVPVPVVAALMVAAYVFGPAGPDKTIVIAPAEQFSTRWRGTGEGLAEMAGRAGGVVGIAGYGLLSALWGAGAGLLFFGAACLFGTALSLALVETRPGLRAATAAASS